MFTQQNWIKYDISANNHTHCRIPKNKPKKEIYWCKNKRFNGITHRIFHWLNQVFSLALIAFSFLFSQKVCSTNWAFRWLYIAADRVLHCCITEYRNLWLSLFNETIKVLQTNFTTKFIQVANFDRIKNFAYWKMIDEKIKVV